MINEIVAGSTVGARNSYWNKFYSANQNTVRLLIPSQFAAFVANELGRATTIIDVGCGNARDSLFFEKYGYNTIGLDASDTAITLAREKGKKQGAQNLQFHTTNLRDDVLGDILDQTQSETRCIYARFFLHAITDAEEGYLLETLASGCRPGDTLALEYRVEADERTVKEAAPHFRRYLTPDSLDVRLTAIGFDKVYGSQGVGYAKYKSEDAIVARGIYRR
jgi:SAM-dependent methyltransferase